MFGNFEGKPLSEEDKERVRLVSAEVAKAQQIMEEENLDDMEINCPICHGIVCINRHPEFGYSSSCEYGCFTTRQ